MFEGNKGFMDAIAGPFRIDWSRERLDRVPRTVLKRYNAEVHSQSALEAVLEIRERAPFRADDVAAIEVETFDVAFHIIGGVTTVQVGRAARSALAIRRRADAGLAAEAPI